jgi:hypothetical protein
MIKRMIYGAALASALFLFAPTLHADTAHTCRLSPLHCDGPASVRAIFPGCTADCGPKETPFCLPGACQSVGDHAFHRANQCYCNTSYFPSPP